MNIPQLHIEDSPDDVLSQHVCSFTKTGVDPLAAIHAPEFDGLVTDWLTVDGERVQLVIKVARAYAKASEFDGRLEGVVQMLSLALDKLTHKDRSDPLWFVYFKGENVSTFNKPGLKGQYEKMSVWPESLLKSGEPDLLEVNTVLTPILAAAKVALAELSQAEQALLDFKKVGSWRKHIDNANAVRASVYGDLLTIPAKNPAAKLHSNYADQFFLHDTSRRGANKPKSSAELTEERDALVTQLKDLEGAVAQAKQREADEAQALIETQEKAQALADLKKANKQSLAKQKELEKELKKKKK